VFPIDVLCQTLGVSRSGFYAWQRRPESARAGADRRLRYVLRVAHRENQQRYGSPRLQRELRDRGYRVGRNRIIRLMRLEDLRARAPRRWKATTVSDPAATPAPNLLGQRFTVAHVNDVWAGDITAIATAEGWLYLAVLLDLCSRTIVGWAVRPTLETELVLAAWHRACGHRQQAPRIHHSDRGAQYTSAAYQAALRQHRVRVSMSRRGNCYDNAPVESFFRTLKTEIADQPYWPTRHEAARAIGGYIDRFYNTQRLHSALDYQSPQRFETTLAAAV
jgi:putative transposase